MLVFNQRRQAIKRFQPTVSFAPRAADALAVADALRASARAEPSFRFSAPCWRHDQSGWCTLSPSKVFTIS